MKNKFVYYPLLVFVLFFVLEKACLHPRIKMLTQTDAVYLYFDYKEELLNELAETSKKIRESVPPLVRNKVFLVLGSSRLMFFSYSQFQRNFPEWEIYNFSAPVTTPAYYLYILERTLERGVVPDYILLETDPYQFNENSSVFVKSNLAYSFDLPFVLKYFNGLKRDEASYFLARYLFAGYKYPPSPKEFYRRITDPESKELVWLKILDEHQRKNRGAGKSVLPREDWYESDFARLEEIAKRDIRRMYGNYEFSRRHFDFLKRLLDLAKSRNIPVLLIRPQVSRPMERLVQKDAALQNSFKEWEEKLNALTSNYGYSYVDLSAREDFYCNTFFDPSHMSLDCYHPMMVLAMREYEKTKERMKQ